MYGDGGFAGDNANLGFDKSASVPASTDKEKQKALKDLRKEKNKQLQELADAKTSQSAGEERRKGSAGIRWKTPPGQKVYKKEDLKGLPPKALLDEQGSFLYTSKAFAKRLQRIKDKYEEDRTNLWFGSLDPSQLVAAVTGKQNVMKQVQIEDAGDVAMDVVIDLSGSTDGDRDDQYRMAMMFGLQQKLTKIPTSIWAGHEEHFELKRADENDTKGITGIYGINSGGTPAARWVEFQRARMALSHAEHKFGFIITDGASFDKPQVKEQVQKAAKEGVKVFGLAFGCSKSDMDEQFGVGNWSTIDDYKQAPQIAWKLIEKTMKGKLRV
jgi:hypothetical protein